MGIQRPREPRPVRHTHDTAGPADSDRGKDPERGYLRRLLSELRPRSEPSGRHGTIRSHAALAPDPEDRNIAVLVDGVRRRPPVPAGRLYQWHDAAAAVAQARSRQSNLDDASMAHDDAR